MTPSSTFHDSACLSASFQPVRSLPLNRAVKPAGGCLTPVSLSAACIRGQARLNRTASAAIRLMGLSLEMGCETIGWRVRTTAAGWASVVLTHVGVVCNNEAGEALELCGLAQFYTLGGTDSRPALLRGNHDHPSVR